MKTTTRRLAALAAAPLLAGVLVAAPTEAQAASTNANATSATYWLANQLTDGIAAYQTQFGPYEDYGLTVDVYFAFKDTGTQVAKQAEVISALEPHVGDYTTGGSFTPDDRYAGATGKLAAAVQAAGDDASDFGGVDLVERAEDRVQENGRATDRATHYDNEGNPVPGTYDDYSNAIGQSWVVRALAGADSAKTDSVVSYLLKQQCSDGMFRLNLEDTQCVEAGSGDEVSVDATALAIAALLEAKEDVPGLDAAIAKANLGLRYAGYDSFGAGGQQTAANANSTGLAAVALKSTGFEARADQAARWLVGKQATKAAAAGTKLSNELGAVALDSATQLNGELNGITAATRGKWIRSTAQAAAGLAAQLPAKKLSVSVKYAKRPRGSYQLVTVKGLVRSESLKLYTQGKRVNGTATRTTPGTWSYRFKVGTSTGTKGVRVYGQQTTRTGYASFSVVK